MGAYDDLPQLQSGGYDDLPQAPGSSVQKLDTTPEENLLARAQAAQIATTLPAQAVQSLLAQTALAMTPPTPEPTLDAQLRAYQPPPGTPSPIALNPSMAEPAETRYMPRMELPRLDAANPQTANILRQIASAVPGGAIAQQLAPNLVPEAMAAGINTAEGFAEFPTSLPGTMLMPVSPLLGKAGHILLGAGFGVDTARNAIQQLQNAQTRQQTLEGVIGLGMAPLMPLAPALAKKPVDQFDAVKTYDGNTPLPQADLAAAVAAIRDELQRNQVMTPPRPRAAQVSNPAPSPASSLKPVPQPQIQTPNPSPLPPPQSQTPTIPLVSDLTLTEQQRQAQAQREAERGRSDVPIAAPQPKQPTRQPGWDNMVENLRNAFGRPGSTVHPAVPPTNVQPAGGNGQQSDNVTVLRQDVEAQKNFLHDLKNLGMRTMTLPEKNRKAVSAQVQRLFDDVQSGLRTPESASEEVASISTLLDNAHKKSKEKTGSDTDKGNVVNKINLAPVSEKINQQTPSDFLPADLDEAALQKDLVDEKALLGMETPTVEGPRLVNDIHALRLKPDNAGRYNGDQLLGTLKNKLHPGEWEAYQQAGIEGALKGKKVSAEEAAKWMTENGPRVKVRKFGEASGSSEQRELAQLEHELDTNPIEGFFSFRNESSRRAFLNRVESNRKRYYPNLTDEQLKKVQRIEELSKTVSRNETHTHWSSIAPKPESDMPGYVEGAVTVKGPSFEQKRQEFLNKIKKDPNYGPEDIQRYTEFSKDPGWLQSIGDTKLDLFPSSHSFPPNTLAFFRGYMETLPNGEKAFHVIEVQSDWAQQVRDAGADRRQQLVDEQARLERMRKAMQGDLSASQRRQGVAAIKDSEQRIVEIQKLLKDEGGHPLLKSYERLALKAAIEHAREQGATKVIVQDAESAMLMEGHDKAAQKRFVDGDYFNENLKSNPDWGLTGKVHVKFGRVYAEEITGNWEDSHNFDSKVKSMIESSSKTKMVLSQEPGMRLHYDQTLPRTMQELTGDAGQRWEGGEHKMAVEREGSATAAPGLGGGGRIAGAPRKDLIFHNPDGTPKTTISGRVFDISRTRSDFSLFGKDKPQEKPTLNQPPRSPVQKLDTTGMDLADLEWELTKREKTLGKFGIQGWQERLSSGAEPLAQWPETFKQKYNEAKHLFGEAEVEKELAAKRNKITFDEARSLQNGYNQLAMDELGLRDGVSAYDVLDKMSKQKDLFGTEYSTLAEFLNRNFEHVLRVAKVHPGYGKRWRANYDQPEHQLNLALGEEAPNIPHRVIHEAAHAATYWALEHPQTELQRRAAKELEGIMRDSWKQLPEEYAKHIGKEDFPNEMVYAYGNLQEFIAGIFSSKELRQHLNSIEYKGTTMWERLWDNLLSLLGVKKGSALDQALNTLAEVGQERGDINENRARFQLDPIAAPEHTKFTVPLDDIIDGPMQAPPGRKGPPPIPVRDASFREEHITARLNKWAGRSAPRHIAANEQTGNWLVRYASAKIAAPEVAKWMATDVLGSRWKDTNFDRILGSVLVEDRLRAIKKGLEDAAAASKDPKEQADLLDRASRVRTLVGSPGIAFRDEAMYQRIKGRPEMQEAIQRHIGSVQSMATRMHEELGGRLAQSGDTGAFVNLMAMMGADSVESANAMIFGSKKGDITNPLRRGSVFNKRAFGTAEAYELSYRKLVERMVRGNYEQYSLQRYYKSLVAKGLAVEEKPNVAPPKTLGGKPLEKVTIDIKGTGPGMTSRKNLWVRADLAGELRQALDTDSKLSKGAAGLLLDAMTEAQVIGPTDLFWHTVNMNAVLAGAQGSGHWYYDLLKKATPIGFFDAAGRLGWETLKAIHDMPEFQNYLKLEPGFAKRYFESKVPEVQRRVAQYSEVGAGRAKPVHRGGVITRGLEKLGVPESVARKVDLPGRISEESSKWLRALDVGGRVAASKMYDELVRRKWAKDTELDRREFINQMGQYNARLMNKWEALARETSLSSFIVAGKNMNRNAVRRLFGWSTGGNAIRALNPQAAAKMKAMEAVSLFSMLYAIPVVGTYFFTGKVTPRSGVPWGAIDTGKTDKDGKPIIYDPLQLFLLRRGMRITGIQGLQKGVDEKLGQKKTTAQVLQDFVAGQIHPWAGPSARFLWTAMSGREPGYPAQEGFLLSRDPHSWSENMWAALKNSNPTMAAYFKGAENLHGKEAAKSGALETVTRLGGALGLKKGRAPSWEEYAQQQSKDLYGMPFEKLSTAEKRGIAKSRQEKTRSLELTEERELGSRSAGERDFWKKMSQQDALIAALPVTQKDWLRRNGLKLPGFEAEVTRAKLTIPATREQAQLLEANVKEQYRLAIDRLMQNPTFESSSAKQEWLGRALQTARKKAWSGVRLADSSR